MCEANEYKKYLHLLNEKNHYKVLGVSQNSSLDEIAREYRHLAKKLHPDMHPKFISSEKEKLSQLFQIITFSFNLLKDDQKRLAFDRELELKNTPFQISPPITKTQPQSNVNTSNDSRLKGGFTFTKLEHVDIDKIRAEKELKDKENALISFEKAKKLISENRNDEAIAILRSLTEKFSNISDYHSYLGLAMQEKGWNGYAQAEFKVALHFNPSDPIALKNYKPSEKSQQKTQNKPENSSVVEKFKSFFNRK